MTAWERWTFNVLAGVVTTSGLAYFWMKYGMTSADPFAVVNHPWQSAMLNLHLIAAPGLILIFGIVFRAHTLSKLMSTIKPNRRSGWFSLVSFAIMALSGYLLQITVEPLWLQALVVVHVASSVIFVAGYATHLVIGLRLFRTCAPRADIPAGAVEPQS